MTATTPALHPASGRRFTLPTPFSVVVVIALCLIPLLYASTLIWANDDPTGNIAAMPAAIVNEDLGASIDARDGGATELALGDEVVDALVDENGDSIEGFDWTLTDADAAEAGLADGSYLAVLTIPADFSQSATSVAGAGPTDAAATRPGVLSIQSNDATNYITGGIAATLGRSISNTLSERVSASYLENVYLGFTSIHESITDAADGAATLAEGAGTLADGTGRLDEGLQTMSSAGSALPAGAATLGTGIGVALSGAQALSSGLDQLRSGTSQLADGAGAALGGAGQLAEGAAALAVGTPELAAGSAELSDGLDQLVAGYDMLTDEQRKGLLATLAAGADVLERGAASVDDAAGALSAGAGQLVGSAVDGTGLSALAAGAEGVRGGAASAAAGSVSLADGLSQVSAGVEEFTVKLSTLGDAIATAADGSAVLRTGTGELADGAGELADGLSGGLEKIPSYSDTQAVQLSTVAAAPVTLDDTRRNAVANNGAGLAPYFLALGLWIGALGVFFIRPALNERLLGTRLAFPLVALRSYLPNALIAIVQAVLAVLVVHTVVGVALADAPGIFGLAVLASLTFMAINQAFIALLGSPGRFVGMLFLVLQLASAGGTYPIQTAAPFFQALHDILPLTDAVQGFRVYIAGGALDTSGWAWSLVLWLVGAFVASNVAVIVQRRRAQGAVAADAAALSAPAAAPVLPPAVEPAPVD